VSFMKLRLLAMDAVAQASRTTRAHDAAATLTVLLALGASHVTRLANLMAKPS
jgi:hypothetical protein